MELRIREINSEDVKIFIKSEKYAFEIDTLLMEIIKRVMAEDVLN